MVFFPACSRKALRQRFSNFLESLCSLPFWPSRSRQMELFNGEGCRQLLRSSWFSFSCSFFWSLKFQANQILFPYFRLFTPAFTFVLVFISLILPALRYAHCVPRGRPPASGSQPIANARIPGSPVIVCSARATIRSRRQLSVRIVTARV